MISGRVLSPFEPCAVVRCYRHVPMSGVILSHRPATSPPGLGDRGEKGALAVMGRGEKSSSRGGVVAVETFFVFMATTPQPPKAADI